MLIIFGSSVSGLNSPLTGTTLDRLPNHCYISFYFNATHDPCRSRIQSSSYLSKLTIDMTCPFLKKLSPNIVPSHYRRWLTYAM